MKTFLIMLPLLGLASCTAPEGANGAAAGSEEAKPVYHRSRFGPGAGYATGVGHSEQASKPVKAESPVKKPGAAGAPNIKPARGQSPAASPAPGPHPAPRKPLFSFLMKKEPPKALVVETPPAPKKPSKAPKLPDAAPIEQPKLDDGGLRLPDMLTMPEKNEFESTNPSATTPQSGGAVIARPPTDPPDRPKPKETP